MGPRKAHSAIVRSATELLLGAHQLSGRAFVDAAGIMRSTNPLTTRSPTTTIARSGRDLPTPRTLTVAPPRGGGRALRQGKVESSVYSDRAVAVLDARIMYVHNNTRRALRARWSPRARACLYVCVGVSHAFISAPGCGTTRTYSIYIHRLHYPVRL